MSTKVINSIENFEGDHCVDVFVRVNGTFGFEEYRRDPEDNSGWFPIGHYSSQVFDTEEEALTRAKASVWWLAADVSN